MFGRKQKSLYYMFPGQTKCNVRHNRLVLIWSCVIGLIVAGALGTLLWVIST